MSSKKLIGITIGDIAGIGPEVTVKALRSHLAAKQFVPVLIGPRDIWQKYLGKDTSLTVIDVPLLDAKTLRFGVPSKIAGAVAYNALQTGIKMGVNGVIDALVTAPLSKESLHLAGYGITGHTEILTALCKTKDTAMLMACGSVFAVIITRHTAIKNIPRVLTRQALINQTSLCEAFLRSRVLHRDIRIALSALNPHSGENGLLGSEERRIIEPALKVLKRKGYLISGPIGADYVFHDAFCGKYDLVVSPCHDHTMIALKLINKSRIINVTVGLPFLRTSPGHGVGFDIAGKNKANPSNMIEAINFAVSHS